MRKVVKEGDSNIVLNERGGQKNWPLKRQVYFLASLREIVLRQAPDEAHGER